MNGSRPVPSATFYPLEHRTRLGTSLLCGLQHVLAMFVGIVTPPLLVAGTLGLEADAAGFLVSMALFTSGLATFVQVRRLGPLGSGLLSVQGTSFTFVPLAIQAGQVGGLPLVFGLTLAGAPVEMVFSRFIGFARRLFPPAVTGSVVMLIGLSLVRVSFVDLAGGAGAADFGSAANLGLGLLVTATILLLHRFGGGFLRTSSIAIGLAAGYAAAMLWGRVSLLEIEQAAWFQVPRPLRFGLAFDPVFLVPWAVGYAVTTIESIGDLTASSAVSRQPVEGPTFVRRLQGGILADGVGSLVAGLFNAMPNTTFSQNNGLIALTGVAARRVGVVVAGMLVFLGLLPKLAALIGIMPRPVLGGATLIMFGMVTLAGFRIAGSSGWDRRSEVLVVTSLVCGLGVTLVPDWVQGIGGGPIGSGVRVILESGLATGAIVATVLNQVLPRDDGGVQA